MKELKKLSLKEEVDRQAQKIEEEVRNRDDLDDIKVSEDMETSLFNKIQEYEYDKRIKKVVHRSKKSGAPQQEKTPSLSGACGCAYSCMRKCDNRYGEQVVLEGAMGQSCGRRKFVLC